MHTKIGGWILEFSALYKVSYFNLEMVSFKFDNWTYLKVYLQFISNLQSSTISSLLVCH